MGNLLLILLSVGLNASAQLFIRQGMLRFGVVSFQLAELWQMIWSVFTNFFLLGGMFCYAISILLWMVVLSKVHVSLAYPFLSIGYVMTAVLAYFIFGEPLTVQKCIGIAIICLGVVILTYSKDFVL